MTKHINFKFAVMARTQNAALRLLLTTLLATLAFISAAADFHIGPSQTFDSLSALQWTTLAPGDTVYIHWRAEPYREKILINNSGAAGQPIRIAGVPGPQGQKPVLDGENATTSAQFRFPYTGTASRGVIVISRSQTQLDGDKPKYIEIDGLEIRNANALYTFQDDQGAVVQYRANASSVFVERGENITISYCTLTGCGNGLFVASSDSEAFQSREILVHGNQISGNGNVNSDREHNVYTEAIGMTFQFNRMGRLRPGAFGNNIKDRSAGTVIRYNWIEGGAQQMDLVDPEGSANQAVVDPRFHFTVVYGNVIINDSTNANVIHYGGDSSITDIYRKGVLHLYHNTVIFRSDQRLRYRVALLRLDTNDEIADVRNNIFYNVAESPGAPLSELSFMQVNGVAFLGTNWVTEGWLPSRTGVPFQGTITGTDRLITGTDPGFVSYSTENFGLAAQSPSIDRATPRDTGLSLEFETLYTPPNPSTPRIQLGPALDLGAFEFEYTGPVLSLKRLPAGQYRIILHGPAGNYRLDLSSNLNAWTEHSTTQSADGNLEFLLTPTNPAQTFYRAVLLSP